MPDWLIASLHPAALLPTFLLIVLGAWHARRITAVEDARDGEHKDRLADLRTMQPVLEKSAVAMQASAEATRQHTAALEQMRQMLIDEMRQRSRA